MSFRQNLTGFRGRRKWPLNRPLNCPLADAAAVMDQDQLSAFAAPV